MRGFSLVHNLQRSIGSNKVRTYVRLRFTVVLMVLLCGAITSDAQNRTASAPLLSLLTTARAVHSLTIAEARRGYPVHLNVVVTYFDRATDMTETALFVHDASGGVYVRGDPGIGLISPGTLVCVDGVSDVGNYGPIVAKPLIRVVRSSRLPETAPRVSMTQLRTGSEDGQWVEVEGIVHAAHEIQNRLRVELAMNDGLLIAIVSKNPGVEFRQLIDAKVLIRGDASPLFNGHGQLTGFRLVVPGIFAFRIEEPGPRDPFAALLKPIDSLRRFDPQLTPGHRVHIRGIVTLQWPGSLLCLRDDTHGLCAYTTERTPVAVGSIVDVSGFPASGDDAPILTDAVFRDEGRSETASPEPISSEKQSLVEHDAELVRLDGQLIGRDLAAADTTLMVAAGKFIIPVVLPKAMTTNAEKVWKDGSRLRVTGICAVLADSRSSADTGGYLVPHSFRILLRSPEDVVVTRTASWFTPAHGLMLVTIALTIALAVLVWVFLLRKRVRESEERYRHQAQHDALTGLPSRLLLQDRLDQALVRSARQGTALAVLMLDLDKFKQINDTYGHSAGDRTLQTTAERLSTVVRDTDTVARMGGDEFVVLLDNIGFAREAEVIAEKVVKALCVPINLGDQVLPVSSSVGVCTTVGTKLTAEMLLKRADEALYKAKGKGRNCYQLYTEDMAREVVEHQSLQTGLARALGLDELELHYQPMVDFRTGQLTGFEALLRWRSKTMGLIMPNEFIALAEQSGLIVPIGEWVLREACREIGSLERRFQQSFRLAVNLSPRQFQQCGLSEVIRRTLAEFGRAPETTEFEITERMLTTDTPETQNVLMELRNLGARIAVDDFGIGFSNLSFITRFSIDTLKIDGSFVRACVSDRNSLAVVRAIVAMAQGLGIHVIAEGIETAEQFEFLREEGCGTAQGYYLGTPSPAKQILLLLEKSDLTKRGVEANHGNRWCRAATGGSILLEPGKDVGLL